MKVYHSISDFQNVSRPILTTGTFDGVHFGHKIIIDRLKEIAKNQNGETVLLTFSPHPRMVLFPDDHNLQLINTLDEKIKLLEQAGIEHLIIHPFTMAFSRTTSMQFVRDIIVNELNTHKLVIGYNHHFGRNREGSFEHLKEYAPLYGFEVEEISAQLIDDVSISSTKIRNSLLSGDVSKAADYLGYNYPLKGQVIEGQQIGRTLGFPTANLKVLDGSKLIPKDGVYAVHVEVKRQTFKGMMNIGNNPSLISKKHSLEVHIFDFDSDIYDEQIEVRFIKHIREEISFDNLDALKIQLEQDEDTAKAILS
ncbi:MAG: bifunctional riboflavin kinase/FAD synthetase [Flavobacteriia bacterium]|nr:bifunctional riboflavin kinase/FAD synthetase [Flavobacteriia bacterium]